MSKAIKEVGFNNGQSNVLVLVGDAGNHDSENDKNSDKYNKKKIIKLLVDKKINLISFQVNNNTLDNNKTIISNRFSSDSKAYIFGSATNILKKMKTDAKIKIIQEKNESYSLGFKGFNLETTQPLYGTFNKAVPGESMKISTFKRNLINSFTSYMIKLDKEAKELEDIIDGSPLPTDGGDEKRFRLQLEDFCEINGLTDYECELLYNEGEVSVAGYTHMKINGYTALTAVAFISKNYKEKIDERLEDLSSIGTSNISEARKKLYETIITIVRGLMGPNTPESVIADKTFDEIWNIILNIDFSENNALKTTKIKDIKNDQVIGSDDLLIFIENLKSEVENFQEFPQERDVKYSSFKNGREIFYWIPFSKIPRGGE